MRYLIELKVRPGNEEIFDVWVREKSSLTYPQVGEYFY